MLVDLELKSWGSKKTDRQASDDTILANGATRSAGRFVKNLLADADAEYLEVIHHQNQIRAMVYARTLTFSANTVGPKRGERLVSATKTFELMKEVNAIKHEHDKAVARLQDVWDQRVAQARVNLKGMARVTDEYPTAAELPDKFAVSFDLRPVPAVSDFARVAVPAELSEALGQRVAEQNLIQAGVALDELKGKMLEELQRMAKQLGKKGDGEKTRMYDSLVTNMQDLVSLAKTMNLHNNPKLTKLADDIEKQLLQRPVEAYRNDPRLAAEVADDAARLAVEASLEEIWK
jgi:molybdopterin converting factor small subunit